MIRTTQLGRTAATFDARRRVDAMLPRGVSHLNRTEQVFGYCGDHSEQFVSGRPSAQRPT